MTMPETQSNGYGPALHPQEDKDLLGRSNGHVTQGHVDGKGSINATRLPAENCEKTDEERHSPIGWIVLDHVICALIVAPLVVAFWWSMWDLMDLLVFPDNRDLSMWICVVAGCAFNGSAYCLQEWTFKRATKASILESIVSHRLYAYLFGTMTISLWRGTWEAWDHYTGTGPISVTSSIVIALVTLIPLRAFRAAKSPPLVLCNDLEFEGFVCTTRFGRQFKDGKILYILDNLFTAWVIHPLYVTLWRGIWTCMDLIIYPGDINKSIWVTLVFGYSLTVFCYLLQIPSYLLYKLITRKKGSVMWKIAVDDVVHIFAHIATIAVWRGWWELYFHFIPGRGGTLRFWISGSVSILILMLMMTGNSVLGHGCEVDGQEDPAPFFYTYYSRYFIDLMKMKNTEAQTPDSKNTCLQNEQEKPLEILSIETSC